MLVTVRLLEAAEVDPCAELMAGIALWQQYGVTAEKARKQFKSGLSDPLSTIQVGLDGDEVIAFIWYLVRGTFYNGGYIRLIGVREDYQGRGIGRQLIQVAEEHIHQHSPHVFLLSSDFNSDAHRFYESLGYQSVGQLPGFAHPAYSEVIFWKVLDQPQ